mgnify:CR=1 FL=1
MTGKSLENEKTCLISNEFNSGTLALVTRPFTLTPMTRRITTPTATSGGWTAAVNRARLRTVRAATRHPMAKPI